MSDVLKINFVSTQNPYQENKDHTPRVKSFRNNLTALSQYCNLLFIASVDTINVFQPVFPLQQIRSEPDLVIHVPRTMIRTEGYADPHQPHAINHLTVGELGDEEILLVSCDDGDVVSYLIRAVHLAILQRREEDEETKALLKSVLSRHLYEEFGFVVGLYAAPFLLSNHDFLLPWFIANVGGSAWGLAIHGKDRLIAVSSNTSCIDVFAPALTQGGPSDSPPPQSPRDDFQTEGPGLKHIFKSVARLRFDDRSENQRLTMQKHSTNIPNIAFYNSDNLDEGRYLASTDIHGGILLWDIYDGHIILNIPPSAPQVSRGWNVACLDRSTSRCTYDPIATFGCQPVRKDNMFIDLTAAMRDIADNSSWHPEFPRVRQPPAMHPTPTQDSTGTDLSNDENEDDAEDESEDESEVEHEHEPNNGPGDNNDGDENEYEDSLGDEAGGVGTEDDDQSSTGQGHQGPPTPQPSQNLQTTMNYPEDTTVLGTHNAYLSQPTHKQPPPKPVLPFNLLYLSEIDICLYSDITDDRSYWANPRSPTFTKVLCPYVMHQNLPMHLAYFGIIERLNMIHQIPELGIVIIGNQIGRAAIVTMTDWRQNNESNESGFKIERIVPTASQEDAGLRPRKPLMGMAVGPIQGHESEPAPGSLAATDDEGLYVPRGMRRFRLMLFYLDHTVLSYEISRPLDEPFMII